LVGKAKKLQQQLKARQSAMAKKRPSVTPSTQKPRKEAKIYMIKGVPYHYKGGHMVKVPIGKPKTKKKKEKWTL